MVEEVWRRGIYLESTYAIKYRGLASVLMEYEGEVLEGGVVFGMVGFEMEILLLTLPRHLEVCLCCICVIIGI